VIALNPIKKGSGAQSIAGRIAQHVVAAEVQSDRADRPLSSNMVFILLNINNL